MRAELANLNHCAVPFLSRAAVKLRKYDSNPPLVKLPDFSPQHRICNLEYKYYCQRALVIQITFLTIYKIFLHVTLHNIHYTPMNPFT